MNVVILTGKLTKDVELKYLPNSEKAVGNTSLAVDRPYQKGKDKEADFLPLVMWGKTAEFAAQYSGKGKLVEVVGSIRTRNYEGKDGKKIYITEILVNDFKPLEWVKKETRNDDADMFAVSNESVPF